MSAGKTMYERLSAALTPATYVSGGGAVVLGMGVQEWAAVGGALAAITTAVANIVFRLRAERKNGSGQR